MADSFFQDKNTEEDTIVDISAFEAITLEDIKTTKLSEQFAPKVQIKSFDGHLINFLSSNVQSLGYQK